MAKKTRSSTLSLSNLHQRFEALQKEHQWLFFEGTQQKALVP